MSKIVFYIIVVVCGQAVLAQKFNGFYIEPTISTKAFTTKASNVPPVQQTEYFTIKPRQFISPVSIYIGLNIGFTLKNRDKIQIGFVQDEVLQGFNAYGTSVTSFTPTPSYGQARYSLYDGVSCTDFSFLYKRAILNFTSSSFNTDRFLKVYFSLGLSYIYKPNNGINSLTGTDGITYTTPDSSKINIAATTYVLPVPAKNSMKLNLGIDFTFGKKDKEFFNLNISFITNKSEGSYFGYTKVESTVTKKSGVPEKYVYYIKGTGNGIYFTLSKRLYPIRWRNERVAKKMAKLKQ